MPRVPRDWSDYIRPRLVPVTGHRDQSTKATYLPWSDAQLGLFGYEILLDDGGEMLVYFIPILDKGVFEIRVHTSLTDPVDPENDPAIGTIKMPRPG